MNGRIIAIGDIHGCHVEFAELLGKLELTPEDTLILLGDLVNRGPDTNRVLDLAVANNAISLLGNHEARLLRFRKSGDEKDLRDGDMDTISKMRPSDWAYLEAMPLTHYISDMNVVFVHGGFLPGIPWQKQPAKVVTRIQVVDREGNPAKRAEAPDAPVWADLWGGPPFVVYGHTPRPEVYRLKWSIGIDTACCMGGYLSAYVLPERRLIQVKARQRYYP